MNTFTTDVREISASEISYRREAEAIQFKAISRTISVVRLGRIVFFSTASQDAWMLDPSGGQCVRLLQTGDFLPIPINETAYELSMRWAGRYEIQGDTFVPHFSLASGGLALEAAAYLCRILQLWLSPVQTEQAASVRRPASVASFRRWFRLCAAATRLMSRGSNGWSST